MDFENSRLGMWKNSYTDKLNWQFKSGYTQTMETGPSRDHTSGQGTLYFPFLLYFLHTFSIAAEKGWNDRLIFCQFCYWPPHFVRGAHGNG